MTGQTLDEEIKRPYEQIYSEANAISLEVNQYQGIRNYEKYISKLNELHRQYIAGFPKMNSSQRTDTYHLINMLQSQIHGKLDVLRAKTMKGEL